MKLLNSMDIFETKLEWFPTKINDNNILNNFQEFKNIFKILETFESLWIFLIQPQTN